MIEILSNKNNRNNIKTHYIFNYNVFHVKKKNTYKKIIIKEFIE